MKRYLSTWCLVGAGFVSAMLLVSSLAQEKPKAKKPPRPALPRFVGDVVTDEQKEQCYRIVEQYEPELDKLRAEIAKVTAALEEARKEREREIDALLSEAQKRRIRELDAAVKAESDKVSALVKQLDEQLDELRAKRDKEIDALLTEAQRMRVKELIEQSRLEAAANKKAKASAKKPKVAAKETADTTPGGKQ